MLRVKRGAYRGVTGQFIDTLWTIRGYPYWACLGVLAVTWSTGDIGSIERAPPVVGGALSGVSEGQELRDHGVLQWRERTIKLDHVHGTVPDLQTLARHNLEHITYQDPEASLKDGRE